MRELTWSAACMEFFGKLPGQSTMEAGKEFLRLTPAERAELVPGLQEALGCTIKGVPGAK